MRIRPGVLLLVLALSGCASSPTGPSGPRATLWPPEGGAVAGIGPGGTHCEASPCTARSGLASDLRLDLSWSQDGRDHVLDVTATNVGGRTYWMSWSCGNDPWSEGLLDHRGVQLKARKPPPPTWSSDDCNACDVHAFGPGAELSYHAVFNETFWHPDGYPVQARPGAYTWGVGLFLWFDEHCDIDQSGVPLGAYIDVTVA